MSPPEPNYPSTEIPKYSNTDGGQEDHITNFMNIKEFINEEINKPLWNTEE